MTLVEIVVGSALLACVGLAAMQTASIAARGTARGGEHQMASAVGARLMDRFARAGYPRMAAHAGTERELDISSIGEDSSAGTGRALACDGLAMTARGRLEQLEDGLIRVEVILSWRSASSSTPGRLELVRCFADPAFGNRAAEVLP